MSETKISKKDIEIIANENMKPKTILVIKTKPTLKSTTKGMFLNDGYEFEVNGAIPEIADGIAKFAKELPKNGFGKGSDSYFITMINQYFSKI